MLNWLFKKEKSILTPEDIKELKDLERKSYMEEARNLMVESGKLKARKQIIIKKEGEY